MKLQKLLKLVTLMSFFFASIASTQQKVAPKLGSNPDLILYNANVITMDETLPNSQAIAVDGNRISAVGRNQDVLALQVAGTQLVDLQGRTVVPGLIEAHSHYLLEGFRSGDLDGLARASQEMAADGYTTVHELFGEAEGLIPALQTLSREGRLAVRVNVYLQYNSNCGEDKVPWMNYPYTVKKDTTLRVIGVKIFADGGSCLCPALSQPRQSYLDECGPYGHLFKTQEEMNTTVVEVLSAGYPIAMHAIGDSAIGVGLNAFENAFAGGGNQLRCRMEHLRVMREDLADQMAELGVAASIQYTWAIAERASFWGEYYLPHVLDWVYSWRRMADRGIPIIGGNDFPFVWHFTQAMQTISLLSTRKASRGEVLPAWMDGEELTVEEGLRAMAVTNAWVAFEEDVKGSVTPGKLADLTVLSQDPLTIDPFEVRDITIEMTIMDGVIRHDRRYAGPNIALNKTATASNSLLDNPPELALDGNLETHWSAGIHPPQWIELDLGGTFTVNRINLIVDQFPDGQTRHQLFGKTTAQDSYELLHEFDGQTTSGQILMYTIPTQWTGRFIKVETLASPSWVAWKEIEVLSAVPTSVSSPENETVPMDLTLSQNYPNPFNPKTSIHYHINKPENVILKIYNTLGQEVITLVDELKPAGRLSTQWNGKDKDGKQVPSGLYLYRIQVGNFVSTKKMLLIRK